MTFDEVLDQIRELLRNRGRLSYQSLKVRFNIIEVNDAAGIYVPPTPDELARFRAALAEHLHQPVVRRYSGGQDVHAGCGMLAAFGATP